MKRTIKTAVVGVSGYTGVELLKILISHPFFEIAYLATSSGGEELESMHPSLRDVFTCNVSKADADEIVKSCHLAFLALPHNCLRL